MWRKGRRRAARLIVQGTKGLSGRSVSCQCFRPPDLHVTHFAVFSPPLTSHVRALEALALELITRGHRVTWVAPADVRGLIRDDRIGFATVGRDSHPPGSLAGVLARAARPGGPLGIRRVIHDMALATDMLCREGRKLLPQLRVDSVISDQMEAAGGLLAAGLRLPCVSVACALPVNRDPRLPLPVMSWSYARDLAGRNLNRVSARVHDAFMAPHGRVIAEHARLLGLPPRSTLEDCCSPDLQLSQTTSGFDFPRQPAPHHLHHVGPLRPPSYAEPPWQWTLQPGVPFVFVSLGTLQGGRFGLFRRIARACGELGVQSLFAHCGALGADQADTLVDEGATWVTDFAPQRTALRMANVAVTHAGLNTVLDSLACGTPLLALPIAFDQPGVAARVREQGAGLVLSPTWSSTGSIRRALAALLEERSFAEQAAWLGAEAAAAGGAPRAADLIEALVAAPASPRDAPRTQALLHRGVHAA